MNAFISDDDLYTFEGFLKGQAIDPNSITAEELKEWRTYFDEISERRDKSPKVGLMKLQPLYGEEKYAVAIRDGSGLWLTLWVRCSRKGGVVIMYPRGDRDWGAHASYHLDGTLHQKSRGAVIGPPLKRQPLTAAFKGSEHLGTYAGHSTTIVGALCDPKAFTGLVVVEPGILGPFHGAVAIDLIGPGAEPIAFVGKVIRRRAFARGSRPSVVITVGIPGLE
jgi:hypothetical protein